MRRNLYYGIGLFAIIIAISLIIHGRQPAPGKNAAPNITLGMVNNAALTVQTLRGQPIVIAFLRPGNPAAGQQARALSAAQQTFTQHISCFVILDTGPGTVPGSAAAKHFVTQFHVTCPLLSGDAAHVAALYHVTVWPTTVWIDRAGNIVRRTFGASSPATLRHSLTSLLRTA